MGISKTASQSSNVGRRLSMGHIKISGQKLFPVSFQFINYDYEYVQCIRFIVIRSAVSARKTTKYTPSVSPKFAVALLNAVVMFFIQ